MRKNSSSSNLHKHPHGNTVARSIGATIFLVVCCACIFIAIFVAFFVYVAGEIISGFSSM
jgi:hypothetical protein